jgi:hypothetical protein
MTVLERCGGTLGLAEQSQLNQLYRQKVDELRAILSPQDLESFELQVSPVAHRLRTAELVGFSPSEQEFRAIFRLAQQADKESGGVSPEPQVMLPEAELRLVLGDKRFGDYQRSQDLTYRRLVEFASHFGLETEVAAQVHDMREAVIQQVDCLRADPRVDDAARETALREIQSEAAKVVRERLGDQAYGDYLKIQLGSWINLIPTWTNGVVFRN